MRQQAAVSAPQQRKRPQVSAPQRRKRPQVSARRPPKRRLDSEPPQRNLRAALARSRARAAVGSVKPRRSEVDSSSRGDGWVRSANVERVWSTHEPGRIRTARQSGRFWTTAVTDGGRLRRRERLRTIVRVWTVRWWVRTVRWWVWTIGRWVRAVERVRAVWWRWVRTAVWFRTTAVTAVAERIQRVRSRVHSNETIGKRLMKSIDINTHSNF